jgi:formamidopyrimidine-DNA glycosylase
MPELPEVETIVRRLDSVLKNKILAGVEVHREKSFDGDISLIKGKPITKVSRRAKLIRFHFPNNLNILAHLKMTGQFIFVDGKKRVGGGHPTSDWVDALPSKHTRVSLGLLDDDKEESLFFNDMRVFGWLRVLTDDQVQAEYDKYGPDINTQAASLEHFMNKLSRTGRNIKQVVMDNKIVSGVGNIYACDGLNLARIAPTRSGNSLSKQEASVLLDSLKHVINLGIELGGATIENYKNVDGFSGGYQNEVLTYGREGENCKNCTGIIQKVKLSGRGTYFCPECQI